MDTTIDWAVPQEVVAQLKDLYERQGYIRGQKTARRNPGSRAYHKGYEARFIAHSLKELREVRRILKAAKLKPGRPFKKGNQWRQPVYGADQIERLLKLVGILRDTSER
jgi:hypothetical protein